MNPAETVDILAASFDADPLFTALFPDRRRQALGAWFGIVSDILGACRSTMVRQEPNLAAVWTTESCPDCLAALGDSLFDLVRHLVGNAGIDLLARVSDASSPQPLHAWNLHWLAVRPEAQGHGHGSAALHEILAAALARGAGLTTMTTNPRAVDFYLRAGFREVGARAVAGVPGLACWTLLATSG